ncbi:AHH domain-containing protein [Vibrio neptunius]|uniref:AHH domain-containing protein n=1 Tax=Vibrio neptunius TaxID=170651 RepID=UPI003CE4F40C
MGGILDTDFTIIEALELTMDFVPVVSNLKAAYEFSTGKTIFGGIDLEPLDRNLAAASIFLGPVAKAAVKTTKVAVTVARHSDEAADLLTASSKVHDATKATDAALGGAKKAPVHHICTNKNCISTARGGPWTPRFDEIFKKAGLDLDDAVNKVAIPGHKGPHPEAYHSYVHKELLSATRGLKANSDEYRNAVTGTLDRIKTEATTVGSQVNRWLTKQ